MFVLTEKLHVMMQVQSAVQEPPRKKGRAGTATPVDNDSCRSCIEACHAVAQALLAVAGDASCTLQWTCSSAPVPAIFQVAHTMLQWHEELIPAISGEPVAKRAQHGRAVLCQQQLPIKQPMS